MENRETLQRLVSTAFPDVRTHVLTAMMLASCDATTSAEVSPSSTDASTCATTKDCAEGKTCYGRKCVDRQTAQPVSAPPPPSQKPDGPTGRAPAFDTGAYCESVSQAAGGSYAIRNACLTDEAAAKRTIQAQSIPDRIYEYCTSVGEVIGGAYSITAQCVRDEAAASRDAVGAGASQQLGTEKLPGFDIEDYCESISQAIGGSFTIKRQCEDDEQKAKLELSRTKLPDRIYKYCQNTAKAIGGSHQIMLVCAQDELKAMGGGG